MTWKYNNQEFTETPKGKQVEEKPKKVIGRNILVPVMNS
jgi:hypothetical protein